MKKFYKYFVLLLLIGLLSSMTFDSYAGNKDRSGQAGANELLINPWARSSGWGNVNTASVKGLEGMFINPAGVAFTPKTEFIFAHTTYLKGSDINIFSAGLTQRLGEAGVLGLSVFNMSFGEIEITTVNNPEGGIGTFKPNYMTIGITYAKAFSNSIYAGISFKIVNESIADASAMGIAIDAGIQYVTGENDQIHFGIALKNIGPRMKYKGDGFVQNGYQNTTDDNSRSFYWPTQDFELPTALDIGAAYDIYIAERMHRVTVAGNFRSNSFGKDQFIFGLEYALKEYLLLHGAYTYEDGITKKKDRTTVYTGPSVGATVQVPLNKEKGSTFSVDYSYRSTDPFDGVHTIGVRLNL